MHSIDEALAADPRADRAAGRGARAAGGRRRARGGRGRGGGGRPAAVRPLGDGRLRGALGGHRARRGAAAGRRRGRGRGERRGAGRGHRGGDLDRRGAAAGRRRDPAVRAGLARRRDGDARARDRARPPRALPRRGRARGRRAGARRRAADAAAAVRAGLRGRRRGRRAPPPAAAPARHRLGAAAARRAARAGAHPRVQRADGARCSRSARARRSSTAASCPTTAQATLEAVERGLAGDVLVVSGGVSVGPHDHVKPAFEACGVEEVLWRVRIKPGKPMWFGRAAATRSCSGCPGNPLSSIVCFCVFIEPALRRLQGERDAAPAARARPPRRAGRALRRAHDVPHGAHRARRGRRARGDPDRAPGLAHDRRAGRERRASRSRRTASPGLAAGEAVDLLLLG